MPGTAARRLTARRLVHLKALPLHPTAVCRVLFVAVAAVNLLQCLLGLRFFNAIYPAGGAAAPAPAPRTPACMLAALSCGVMWLVFYGHMSVLPFR